MWGSATLTIVESSTSMNVGTTTAAAISQGLTLMGSVLFKDLMFTRGMAVESVHADFRLDGDSRAERNVTA